MAVVTSVARAAPTPLPPDKLTITVHHAFGAIRAAWLQLEKRGEYFAFQRYCWIATWYEEVGAGAAIRPCLVLVEDPAGAPLMLLPLGIQRRAGVACLVWLGGALADYQGPLLSPGCVERLGDEGFTALWHRVKAALPRFDAVVLERQPERILSQQNPFTGTACQLNPSGAHYTALAGSLEIFIKRKRSTKWAANERRKERRLAEYGEIRFVVATSEADVDRLLPEIIRQKRRRYAELGVSDLFADEGYVAFVRRLANEHVLDAYVFVCALLVGDRLAAGFWGLVHDGRLYHLLPTYGRDELTRYSPGNMLLRNMFDWGIHRGLEVFDFTIGDEPYKLLWCDQSMRLYDRFESTGIRGLALIILLKWQRRLKRAIKRSTWLWGTVQALRARAAHRR